MKDLTIRLFNGVLYVYDSNNEEIDTPIKSYTTIEQVEVGKFFEAIREIAREELRKDGLDLNMNDEIKEVESHYDMMEGIADIEYR